MTVVVVPASVDRAKTWWRACRWVCRRGCQVWYSRVGYRRTDCSAGADRVS